ncbi:MAG: hypothetical protein AAFS03_02370 [Pseudomonadota bacterium]
MSDLPPMPDIRTLDDLYAHWVHDPLVAFEIASFAVTRIQARGRTALHSVSTIEMAAMAMVLSTFLPDHPDVAIPAAPSSPDTLPTATGVDQ